MPPPLSVTDVTTTDVTANYTQVTVRFLLLARYVPSVAKR